MSLLRKPNTTPLILLGVLDDTINRTHFRSIQQGIEIDIDKKRTYWKTIHAYDVVLSDYIIPKNIFPADFDTVLKNKMGSLNIDYGPHYKF